MGQLGLGTNNRKVLPTLVPFSINERIKTVKCGNNHTAIITENDQLYTFGLNDWGQLGLGNIKNKSLPTLVPLNKPVWTVSCGVGHTAIIIEE